MGLKNHQESSTNCLHFLRCHTTKTCSPCSSDLWAFAGAFFRAGNRLFFFLTCLATEQRDPPFRVICSVDSGANVDGHQGPHRRGSFGRHRGSFYPPLRGSVSCLACRDVCPRARQHFHARSVSLCRPAPSVMPQQNQLSCWQWPLKSVPLTQPRQKVRALCRWRRLVGRALMFGA